MLKCDTFSKSTLMWPNVQILSGRCCHKQIYSRGFFVDNKLRFESEILGVESKLSDMLNQVRHIEKSDKPKSEVMASLM